MGVVGRLVDVPGQQGLGSTASFAFQGCGQNWQLRPASATASLGLKGFASLLGFVVPDVGSVGGEVVC